MMNSTALKSVSALLVLGLCGVSVATLSTGCNFSLSGSAPGSTAATAGGIQINAAHSTFSASALSLPANGTTTLKISLKVADAQGVPIANEPVKISSNRGIKDQFTPNSAITDANGLASFTMSSAFSGTAVLSYVDLVDNSNFASGISIQVIGSTSGGSSSVSVAQSSLAADGVSTVQVTVKVIDQNHLAIPGKNVVLKALRSDTTTGSVFVSGASNGSASGASSSTLTESISAGSGPSDKNGIVTFTLSSQKTGLVSLNAYDLDTSTGLGQTSITFTPNAPSASLSTVTYVASSPSSTPSASPSPTATTTVADGVSTAGIQVVLLDTLGNPIAGKTIQIASSRGSSDTLAPSTATTDSTGTALFTVVSSTPGQAQISATDTTDGMSLTPTARVTFISMSQAIGSVIWKSNPSSTYTASTSVPMTSFVAALLDTSGNVMTNNNTATITLSLSTGTGTLLGTLTQTVTAGQATFSTIAYAKAENIVIKATENSSGSGNSVSQAITVGANSAAKLAFSQAPSSTAVAGSALSTQPKVQLQDANGNSVKTTDADASDTITLTAYTTSDCSTTAGSGTLSGASVSASSGLATFSSLSDSTAETVYFKATDATHSLTTACTSGSTAIGASSTIASVAWSAAPATTYTASNSSAMTTFTAKLLDANSNLITSNNTTTTPTNKFFRMFRQQQPECNLDFFELCFS